MKLTGATNAVNSPGISPLDSLEGLMRSNILGHNVVTKKICAEKQRREGEDEMVDNITMNTSWGKL